MGIVHHDASFQYQLLSMQVALIMHNDKLVVGMFTSVKCHITSAYIKNIVNIMEETVRTYSNALNMYYVHNMQLSV